MKSTFLLAAGFQVALSAIAPIPPSRHNGTCDRGLHIIVARGTLEPDGPGHMGRVAEIVAKMIPGSTVSDVNYPASVDYYPSEALGIESLSVMMIEYHSRCPHNPIALMGYSQVCPVFDSLRACHKTLILEPAGCQCCWRRALRKVPRPSVQYHRASHGLFRQHGWVSTLLPTLHPADQGSVVAAVMFGDPSHVAGQPWNEGTSQRSGVRDDLALFLSNVNARSLG